MVVTIFRSRLQSESVEDYRALAPKILDLARSMPGFRSFKSFTAEDGERISIIEFDSHPQLEAWRDHPEHRKAQELGRKRFYSGYQIQVCELIRAHSFEPGHQG